MPKNLPEKPSAIPRSINNVLSKLLPSNSKNIAKNKAVMEIRIERMRFSMNFEMVNGVEYSRTI